MHDTSLKENLDYFKAHQDELVAMYPNRYLVIKDREVVGDYATEYEAYVGGQKLYPLGTFTIQECKSGVDAYTQTFHSRAVFA